MCSRRSISRRVLFLAISIPHQNGFEVRETAQILYSRADDNFIHLNLKGGGSRLLSKTLQYFEDILKEKGFARVHKSFLVNVAKVVAYQKGKRETAQLSSGKRIALCPSPKNQLLSFFLIKSPAFL